LPVVHYFRATGLAIPANDDTTTLAAAFLIGVSAMWISDIVVEVGEAIQAGEGGVRLRLFIAPL
jgi:hypothetical protein